MPGRPAASQASGSSTDFRCSMRIDPPTASRTETLRVSSMRARHSVAEKRRRATSEGQQVLSAPRSRTRARIVASI